MAGRVYLDHNATTPVRPEAAQAVGRALSLIGNPSSVHAGGRAARRAVEDARDRLAALVNAKPGEIVFTSGGTEANNLAVRGAGRHRVLAAAVEHDSVLNACQPVETLPVDGEGVVDLAALEATLAAGEPALVSVMLANNETGVVQPVGRVVEIARRHGALVHSDAAQGPGRLAVDFAGLGVDFLTLSAHKMGGPQGVGALVVRDGRSIVPLLAGGGQERGRRAGTEAVASIAGFAAAAAVVMDEADEPERLKGLRDGLERRLAAIAPEARVFGAGAERLPNTTCVAMPGVASATQVMALDLAGFAVSAGAACSSGKVAPSRVLKAMGVAEAMAASAIRVSLGWTTTEAGVRDFAEAWAELRARLADSRPGIAAGPTRRAS